MEFWRAILGLVRRPLIGPPVLLVCLGIAAVAYVVAPTQYASSTTLVLTTPPTGGTLSQDPSRPSGLSNPLLNFGEGLRTTATILIQAMNTPDAKAALGASAGGPTELVVDDGRTDPMMLGTNGPFVHIACTSTSAATAREVVSKAHQFVEQELVRRQQALGAPQSTFIMAVEVTPPSEPQALRGTKAQAAAVAMVLGLVAGFGGSYLLTTTLRPRRHGAARPAVAGSGGRHAGVATVAAADSPTVVFPKVPEAAPPRGAAEAAAPVNGAAATAVNGAAPMAVKAATPAGGAADPQSGDAGEQTRPTSGWDLVKRDRATSGAGPGRPWQHPQPVAPTPASNGPEA